MTENNISSKKHKKLSSLEINEILDEFCNANKESKALFFQSLFLQISKDSENDSKEGRVELGKMLKDLSLVMESVREVYKKVIDSSVEEICKSRKLARRVSDSNYDSLVNFYKEWKNRLLFQSKELVFLALESIKISEKVADLCRPYNERVKKQKEVIKN